MVRPAQTALVAAGVAYLLVLGWAVLNLSYDLWGAFVVAPILLLAGLLVLRRMFSGELALLLPFMAVALVLKTVGGAMARYWVAFDAYGGKGDALAYHLYGKVFAGRVWDGTNNLGSVLPGGQGTVFIERLTSFLYTFVGSSKLAGFVIFSFLAFWGLAFTVKGACLAVPGLARRRYAVLAVLAPSLVFWPSAIGKEAWMCLCLGVASYGVARLVARAPGWLPAAVVAALGIAGAALVRPHVAGIWVGGAIVAIFVMVLRPGRGTGAPARRSGWALLAALSLAGLGAVLVGQLTLRYLDPKGEETDVGLGSRIGNIFDETNRRSEQGGSEFAPPVINGPQDWPLAIARTLTRPLLIEANDLESLLPALEMTVFLALCVLSWRRVVRVPALMLKLPFVSFAVTVVLLYGLAFSSIGNLGILTRQRSLVLPLLFLIPCLPRKGEEEPVVTVEELTREQALSGLLALEAGPRRP